MREIASLSEFHDWVRNLYGSDPLPPAAIQGLDLTGLDTVLSTLACPGSLFLGCTLSPAAAGGLVSAGALVLRTPPGRAHSVHRAELYRVDELFDRFDPAVPGSWHDCLDQRIYREYLADGPDHASSMLVGMLRALHDHSISDALWGMLEGHRVVAVMGGHALKRRDPGYAAVVRISKRLTELGYLMTTGGGPGAMEAAHLGAWLAEYPDDTVEAVLASPFTQRPDGHGEGGEYADKDWLSRAWAVRERWPRTTDRPSIGIPTWLYGHEPPTCFATHIAKYFANAIREDGVLAIARHGVIFAPGNAGTTQEIFQDACQNHYATVGLRSPMVLLDTHYWSQTRPVWPLLDAVTRNEPYQELITVADTDAEVLQAITSYDPERWRV